MTNLTVAVGEEIPPFVRRTGLPEWNRYAAVNEEFIPFHMDDAAARESGLPGAIGMGLLQVAYLHNAVRDWLDDRGRILAFSCRFRAMNTQGQTVSAGGRITQVTEGPDGTEAVLEIWTADGDGNRLAPGACTVLIDRDSQ